MREAKERAIVSDVTFIFTRMPQGNKLSHRLSGKSEARRSSKAQHQQYQQVTAVAQTCVLVPPLSPHPPLNHQASARESSRLQAPDDKISEAAVQMHRLAETETTLSQVLSLYSHAPEDLTCNWQDSPLLPVRLSTKLRGCHMQINASCIVG